MRLLTLCLLALAQPALAQADGAQADGAPGGPPGGGHGGWGRPLARADVPAQVAQGFNLLDVDGDGVVTRTEVDRYRAARREAMRARREGGDMPLAEGGRRGGGMRGPGPLLSNPAWFGLADPTGSGRVTLAQAQTGALALFDRLDSNHDGQLDRDERRAGMARGGPDGAPPVGGPA